MTLFHGYYRLHTINYVRLYYIYVFGVDKTIILSNSLRRGR